MLHASARSITARASYLSLKLLFSNFLVLMSEENTSYMASISLELLYSSSRSPIIPSLMISFILTLSFLKGLKIQWESLKAIIIVVPKEIHTIKKARNKL